MFKYNFDKKVDRLGTGAVKWDIITKEYSDDEIIPLWVADMDFEVPKEVRENIEKRLEHEIFGYTMVPDSYYEAAIGWFDKKHGWKVEKDWMVFTPGVVTGLNALVRTFSDEGDDIIIQTPVYHQFPKVIESTGRNIVDNPLIERDGDYSMDFDNLKKVITDKTKILILCNPHNPVGRSWTEQELRELGEICLENDILVISDEIHSDLVYGENEHFVYSKLGKKFEDKSIVCTAPNKTFNIAGLKTANIVIANDDLRKEFEEELDRLSIGGPTILGMIAQESVYKYGWDWYEGMMEYVEGNIDYVVDYINKNIPKIKVKKPESTYLLWLDCRDLGMEGEELSKFFIEKCKVLFNDGEVFGSEYNSYVRMNIATRRDLLTKALDNMKREIDKL